MNINVHIERLALEGLPLILHQGPASGDALQLELARLLSGGQLSRQVKASGVIPRLDGGVIAIGSGMRAEGIGQQLAQRVLRVLLPMNGAPR